MTKETPEKITTHTTYAEPGDMHFWTHPLDIHFQARAINGWPKCVFRVWKVDDAEKLDICKINNFCFRDCYDVFRFVWCSKFTKDLRVS